MPGLNIVLDGDNCWPDLKELRHIEGELEAVAMLEGGMASGKPSVMLRIQLPDGQTVLAETSLLIFLAAARAMRGRCEAKGIDLDGA